MENQIFDKDFYDFFANLITDKEEIELLRMVLEGKDEATIVAEYLLKLGEKSDDQN